MPAIVDRQAERKKIVLASKTACAASPLTKSPCGI